MDEPTMREGASSYQMETERQISARAASYGGALLKRRTGQIGGDAEFFSDGLNAAVASPDRSGRRRSGRGQQMSVDVPQAAGIDLEPSNQRKHVVVIHHQCPWQSGQ
jgi:hypothetical protein